VFPGNVQRVHVSFDDPPLLARDAKSEEEAMSHYRRVREEIRQYVVELAESIRKKQGV
jgi:arsenate reductase (thioredoxin)